ncbi:DivIVA domain-containing protein [bacterium]|nr:DivIVA domain-containing protein [bacterium]
MSISIPQIRDKEFSTKAFGYSKREVREFLEFVANEIYQERTHQNEFKEKETKEKEFISHKATEAVKGVEELKRREELIQKTLLFAENAKAEMISNARKEAENIIREAEIKAKKTINEARHFLNQLDYQYLRLKEEKRMFLLQTAAQFKTYLDRIEKDPAIARLNETSVQAEMKKIKADNKPQEEEKGEGSTTKG